MLRPAFVATVLLVVAACGGEPAGIPVAGVAGSYVMGSSVEARRKATEPEVEDPNAPQTLGELFERAEAGEEFTFSASVDILLVLHEDGTFEYYGPLKMGDDQALVRGHWGEEAASIHLRPDEPRRSRGEVVSLLVCPWRPGVVEYPLGRDPAHQVYDRLVDTRRLEELGSEAGVIHIGGERTGGD